MYNLHIKQKTIRSNKNYLTSREEKRNYVFNDRKKFRGKDNFRII